MNLKLMNVAAVDGLLLMPGQASADDRAGAAIAGAVIGALAASAIPVEQREPAREYIYRDRERPRSYEYYGNLEVGQRFGYGPHGSRELPRQYGVEGYHYDVVNRRAVVFQPHTRRIIHVYDVNDED
jgi:hypothetical protein